MGQQSSFRIPVIEDLPDNDLEVSFKWETISFSINNETCCWKIKSPQIVVEKSNGMIRNSSKFKKDVEICYSGVITVDQWICSGNNSFAHSDIIELDDDIEDVEVESECTSTARTIDRNPLCSSSTIQTNIALSTNSRSSFTSSKVIIPITQSTSSSFNDIKNTFTSGVNVLPSLTPSSSLLATESSLYQSTNRIISSTSTTTFSTNDQIRPSRNSSSRFSTGNLPDRPSSSTTSMLPQISPTISPRMPLKCEARDGWEETLAGKTAFMVGACYVGTVNGQLTILIHAQTSL